MDRYVVMCKSLSFAQRGQRLLAANNIVSYIVKAPQNLSLEGCSYGLKIKAMYIDKTLLILKSSGIRVGKVFGINSNGSFTEVAL